MTNLAPALRSPGFRRFWLAQLISTIGMSLQVVAEGWLVYQLTRSTFWLGMVGLLALIPVLPISLIGGLLIDRLPRRKLILATQTALLVQALIFSLLVTFGSIRLWHLVVLYFVFGAILAIDHPARRAFLVELVDQEDFANAVALNAALFNFSGLIGYTLGGFLIALVGAGSTMLINAATYIAPIIALTTIRSLDSIADGPAEQITTHSLPGAMTEGLRFLWKQPTLIAVIGLMAVVGGLTNPVFGMMPATAEALLPANAIGLGILMAAGALGAVLGSVIVARVGGQQRGRLLLLTSICLGALIVAFAFVSNFPAACLLLIAIGAGLLVLQSLAVTLVQIAVPDRLRGRVMTLYGILHAGSDTGGNVVVGWLALYIGLPLALAAGGLLAATSALGVRVFRPDLSKVE